MVEHSVAVAHSVAAGSVVSSPELEHLQAAASAASLTAVHYYFAEPDFAVADQTAAQQPPALLLAAQDCEIPAA